MSKELKIAETTILVKANGHAKFHYTYSDDSIFTRCGISFGKKETIEKKPLNDISEKFDICERCLISIS